MLGFELVIESVDLRVSMHCPRKIRSPSKANAQKVEASAGACEHNAGKGRD